MIRRPNVTTGRIVRIKVKIVMKINDFKRGLIPFSTVKSLIELNTGTVAIKLAGATNINRKLLKDFGIEEGGNI